MTKASDNPFPSILIEEATEPSAPAAGHQRLYIDSTSHKLKATNSSGTDRDIEGLSNPMTTAGDIIYGGASGTPTRLAVGTAGQVLKVNAGATAPEWGAASGGGGGILAFDYNVYVGGDIALSSTSPAAVTGPTDLTVAASTGDVVMLGISAIANNTTGQSIGFDFATIVSASPVNYVSSGNGTPVNIGVMGWFIPATAVIGVVSGSYGYVVQAGDISGGNVVFRLYARVSGNRTLSAQSTIPLWTQATNFGQP